MTSDESDLPGRDDEKGPKPPVIRRTSEGVGVRAMLAWLAIGLCVLFIAVTGEQAAETREAEAAGVTLRSAGRYAVGVHSIIEKFGPGIPVQNLTDTLVTQLDQSATTPVDRLYVIPVIAEIQGANSALDRLDKMRFGPKETALRQDAEEIRTIYESGVTELSPREATRLVERMGWLGELALSWEQPEDAPIRRAAIEPAMRTAIGALVVVPLTMLAGAIGLALLIGAAARYRSGKLRMAGAESLAHRSRSNLMVESFAFYLIIFVLMQAFSRLFPAGRLSLVSIALYALAPFACLWPLTQGMPFSELRSRLGWHTGRGFFKEIGCGIAGYVAGLPVMGAGVLITVLLSRLVKTQPSHPISEWIAWDFWRIVGLLALASVFAPLAEETMFRGAFYSGVRGRLSAAASAVIVAFVFAAIHPQGWTAIPVLMSIAIVLALLREWRGSLIASMTAHALNNAVVVVVFALVAG